MMTTDKIKKTFSEQLKEYKNIVDEGFAKTVPYSYAEKQITKMSGNRSHSNVLRKQFFFFEKDSDWIKLATAVKKALRNDQRVFVQKGDDVWDVYKGNETATPDKIISGKSGLEDLLKKQILELSFPPMDPNSPLQQIFYGAPGTGKSFEIKRITKGQKVIRTTFHPDSDYSTFVGAYKPTMEESDIVATPVVVSKGAGVFQSTSTYKENRISYKFVKQAFLKAYLSAWKKLCAQTPPHKNVSFRVFNAVYTIISVDDKELQQKKTDLMRKSKVRYTWDNDLWKTGSFKIPTGRRPGASVQEAISNGIMAIDPSFTKDDFDKGWDSLLSELKAKNTITVSASKKEYELSLGENDDYVLFFTVAKNKKTRIEKCYNEEVAPEGVEGGIIDILNGYEVNTFDEAWKKLKEDVMGSTSVSENLIAPQFLIIEEINRGNCAQIFGDLFQLLDRQDNGFSEYPIEADTDLQQEIEKAFNEPGEYRLDNGGINVEGVVENYTSNYGATLSKDIQHGRILLLPSNLFIWATMNTSDQSLFPIDSAFKRRWEWKYIKITNGFKKDANGQYVKDSAGKKIPLNWEIGVKDDNDKNYDWWEFLQKINAIIASMTSSADKQLGYFFCKADENGIINEETFVSKVIFYLWNDVFKDYGFEDASLFRYEEDKDDKTETKDLTFPDFYNEDGDKVNSARVADFVKKVMEWNKDKEDKE